MNDPLFKAFKTGVVALAEGIAVGTGRSFSMFKNYHIDGNKEMIAIGMMNIAGSCTSCHLTTAKFFHQYSRPFSRSAVNYNAGCTTAMSNVVMEIAVMFALLFLTPLFHYTPLTELPPSITLSLSRASLSLSSGSRPPPQPATFWPAVQSSGHHSGRDRSQNDRPDFAVLPHPFSDVSRQRYRRKLQKNGRFLPRFSGARSGDSGHQILRSRYGFSPIFRALAACWAGIDRFVA
ncbi:unnamed protein product [Prunus armeniaca]